MTNDEQTNNEKSNNWIPKIGNIRSKIAKEFEEDWDKYYSDLKESNNDGDSKN